MDNYSRFSSKAEVYANYRWNYHPEAIDKLCQIANINQESIIADIGSGTGMISAFFIDKAKTIYGIEPNLKMRTIAESDLGQYPNFVSIDALADATTLADNSVDLIIVGRAIHWFDQETTPKEFLRILKPNGWFATCRVTNEDMELFNACRTLRRNDYGWNVKEDKSLIINKGSLADDYFQDYQIIKHESIVTENFQQFIGRMISHSPAPDRDSSLFSEFQTAVKQVFDQHKNQNQNQLEIKISTQIKLGRLK